MSRSRCVAGRALPKARDRASACCACSTAVALEHVRRARRDAAFRRPAAAAGARAGARDGAPVLLLDEPLSNLDAKLRERMRFELKRLQRELRVTTVYVTHDQSEALALSHEIGVMNDGRLVQVGSPRADLRAAGESGSSPISSARRTSSTARVAAVKRRRRFVRVETELGVLSAFAGDVADGHGDRRRAVRAARGRRIDRDAGRRASTHGRASSTRRCSSAKRTTVPGQARRRACCSRACIRGCRRASGQPIHVAIDPDKLLALVATTRDFLTRGHAVASVAAADRVPYSGTRARCSRFLGSAGAATSRRRLPGRTDAPIYVRDGSRDSHRLSAPSPPLRRSTAGCIRSWSGLRMTGATQPGDCRSARWPSPADRRVDLAASRGWTRRIRGFGFRGDEPLGADCGRSSRSNSGSSSTRAIRSLRAATRTSVWRATRLGRIKIGNFDTVYKEIGDSLSFLGVSSGNFVSNSNVLSKQGFGNELGGKLPPAACEFGPLRVADVPGPAGASSSIRRTR